MSQWSETKRLAAVVSSCTLLIAFFVFLILHDLFYQDGHNRMGLTERFAFDFSYSLGHLFLVGLFVVPALVWHLADFVLSHDPTSRIGSIIGSFRLMFITMLTGLFGSGIVVSGLTERIQCWSWEDFFPPEPTEGGNEFGFWCDPYIYNDLEFWVLPFVLAMVLLAFLKLGAAIATQVRSTV